MNSVDVVGEVFPVKPGTDRCFPSTKAECTFRFGKDFEVSQCRLTCGSMYGSAYRNKPAVMKEKGFG